MIILSVGMPRAGSGWYYNLTHDLVTAAGGKNAREIRQQFHLQKVLTEVNCNIGSLSPWRLIAVLVPTLFGNTFAIKAHAGPTRLARQLILQGIILPTYIFRDPRDAMLSAMDYGRRALKKGRPNAFSHLVDFETAMDFMLKYLYIWEAWNKCDRALRVKYEDLLENYKPEVMRLIQFLELEAENGTLERITEKYKPDQASQKDKGLHFNKGKIGRFRREMTVAQQGILMDKFGPYLERMGYKK